MLSFSVCWQFSCGIAGGSPLISFLRVHSHHPWKVGGAISVEQGGKRCHGLLSACAQKPGTSCFLLGCFPSVCVRYQSRRIMNNPITGSAPTVQDACFSWTLKFFFFFLIWEGIKRRFWHSFLHVFFLASWIVYFCDAGKHNSLVGMFCKTHPFLGKPLLSLPLTWMDSNW